MTIWMSLQKSEMSVQSNYDNVSAIIEAGLIIDRNDNNMQHLYRTVHRCGNVVVCMLYFYCATVWIQYAQRLNLR